MKYTGFFFVFGMVFFAFMGCKPRVETIITETPALRASEIYEVEKVYDYMLQYGTSNIEIGNSYFEKGKELESSNLTNSIYYIKRAITLCPTLNWYIELGKLLQQNGQMEEDNKLYQMLVTKMADQYNVNMKYNRDYLFGPPDINMYAESFVVSLVVRGERFDRSGEGIINDTKTFHIDLNDLRKRVLSDKRLQFDTTGFDYEVLCLTFMSDSDLARYQTSEAGFRSFLASIKDTSSRFEIDKNSVRKFNYEYFNGSHWGDEQSIYRFDETVNIFAVYLTKQDNGRYNFEHKVKINDSVFAVIYAIDSSAFECPIDMRQIYHQLVTYNKHGNIIASAIIASQEGEQLSTCRFNRNGCTVSHYKRYWEKPYNGRDFDNYLIKTEFLNTTDFNIMPDGTILSHDWNPHGIKPIGRACGTPC